MHALRGLPSEVDVGWFEGLDGAFVISQTLRSTTYGYTWAHPYAALDGRSVITASHVEIDTSLYGDTDPTANTKLEQTRDFDSFGNESADVDFGVVSSNVAGVQTDTPIRYAGSWALPSGDTTGWRLPVEHSVDRLCRPVRSQPSGSRSCVWLRLRLLGASDPADCSAKLGKFAHCSDEREL